MNNSNWKYVIPNAIFELEQCNLLVKIDTNI